MEEENIMDDLKYAILTNGELSVMIFLVILMQQWLAVS